MPIGDRNVQPAAGAVSGIGSPFAPPRTGPLAFGDWLLGLRQPIQNGGMNVKVASPMGSAARPARNQSIFSRTG